MAYCLSNYLGKTGLGHIYSSQIEMPEQLRKARAAQ
jgi:hypothetical protein